MEQDPMEWVREQDGAWVFVPRVLVRSLTEDSQTNSLKINHRQNRPPTSRHHRSGTDTDMDEVSDLPFAEDLAGEAEDHVEALGGAAGSDGTKRDKKILKMAYACIDVFCPVRYQ
ncbi:MAG: hypothetical protein ACQEQU_03425 [Spirochaetota bacterium]